MMPRAWEQQWGNKITEERVDWRSKLWEQEKVGVVTVAVIEELDGYGQNRRGGRDRSTRENAEGEAEVRDQDRVGTQVGSSENE